MARNQTEYNEIIGITSDGEIIMLDYTFEDTMHDKPFCGATGTSLMPVHQDYINERNDKEYLRDEYLEYWQDAAKHGYTEDSFEDWIDQVLLESDVNGQCFPGHDDSSVHLIPDEFKEKYFPEFETFECIGGGRMFDAKDKRDWKVLLRPDLLKEIERVESLNTK